jgi:hypothetical protein
MKVEGCYHKIFSHGQKLHNCTKKLDIEYSPRTRGKLLPIPQYTTDKL